MGVAGLRRACTTSSAFSSARCPPNMLRSATSWPLAITMRSSATWRSLARYPCCLVRLRPAGCPSSGYRRLHCLWSAWTARHSARGCSRGTPCSAGHGTGRSTLCCGSGHCGRCSAHSTLPSRRTECRPVGCATSTTCWPSTPPSNSPLPASSIRGESYRTTYASSGRCAAARRQSQNFPPGGPTSTAHDGGARHSGDGG